MKITRERYEELGLGIYEECCLDCMFCYEANGVIHCDDIDIPVREAIQKGYECPCIDHERLKSEMTEEEYDAYRHNRLEVIE